MGRYGKVSREMELVWCITGVSRSSFEWGGCASDNGTSRSNGHRGLVQIIKMLRSLALT